MTKHPAEPSYDVAIAGGGFSGLAIAYRLAQLAPHLKIVLLEASDRLGGKALTVRVETTHGQFLIEAGPDSFLAAKPWARELAVDLGLESQLLPINRVARPVSIVRNGALIRMPAGLSLAAPALIKPFARSSLLSPSGRARALREPRIPAGEGVGDESVGAFIRRRLGPEMLDWIAEPLMAGIYNGDPDQMSLLATFPQLRIQEREQGGLIRSTKSTRMSRRGGRQPTFLTFVDGVETLTRALASEVKAISRCGSRAVRIEAAGDGAFRVRLDNQTTLNARQVVLAVPAREAASLIEGSLRHAAGELAKLRTNPAGSISLALRDTQITRPLPGYGLLVPLKEARPINAITVASRKFDQRAPASWSLLRVFFGGARSPETMLLNDDDLLDVAMAQLGELLGVSSPPLFHRIVRWPSGSPQYDVGHLERIADIEHALPVGVHLAGSSYRGVGLPDLANEANQLARRLAFA